MATRYFIYGAAFNGDGTTSAEATSNGGVGAWSQDTILTGTAPTFGTLAGGDIVYIRSKTGNGANADISRTVAASLTLGAPAGVATITAPVTWVLDNGAVWSGVNGTLTYTTSNVSHSITLRQFNRFIANTPKNWILEQTGTGDISANFVTDGGTQVESDGLHVKASSYTAMGGGALFRIAGTSTHRNLQITAARRGFAASNPIIDVLTGSGADTTLVNPSIELLSSAGAGPVFNINANITIRIYGGQLYGAGISSGLRFLNIGSFALSAGIECIGFQIPKAVQLDSGTSISTAGADVTAFGLDGGSGGAIASTWGTADSRNIDNFYPALNATLPDSASSRVSWRLWPSYATPWKPARLAMGSLYTAAAAAKTVTLEFLIANPFTGGTAGKQNVWMELVYIDNATGLPVFMSTRSETNSALDTSTAAWTATTWGAVGFNKRKLSLTTTGSIKQDTQVFVYFCTTLPAANANELFMVCPDPQFT